MNHNEIEFENQVMYDLYSSILADGVYEPKVKNAMKAIREQAEAEELQKKLDDLGI